MKVILFILLGIHSIVSLIALKDQGMLSVFPPFQELFVYQIFSDLVVSLSLVLIFIYKELKLRNKPILPFVFCCVGVVFLGSFSVLVYLILNRDLFSKKHLLNNF